MPDAKNLRAVADRVEALTGELAALPDRRIGAKAEELVRLLMELYGAGLARMLEVIDETGGMNPTLLDRLAADDLVASLLLLHGLHPQDIETRITRALGRVRPYLASHGGDVKLLAVKDGIALLRLEGSCHGCPSSTITMKLAIEKAIEEAAPEFSRIELEEKIQGDASPMPGETGSIETIRTAHKNGRTAQVEWLSLDPRQLKTSDLVAVALGGMNLLVCRVGDTLYAYEDCCPSCGATLTTKSVLRESLLHCPTCNCTFDVRRAGQCENREGIHMTPLPLIMEQDAIKIAIAPLTV